MRVVSLALPIELTVPLGRRRKKSCIPHPADPNICTECYARGAVCREQEPSKVSITPPQDSRQSLQQRVAELENALQSITRTLGNTESTVQPEQSATKVLTQLRSEILLPTPASSAAPSPENGLDNAPIFSLFNNAILSRRQDDGSSIATPSSAAQPAFESDPAAASKMEGIRQTLLSLFPPQQRLEAILDAAYPWWASWQHNFPEIFGAGSHSTFKDFVKRTRSSGNVPQLAKALLCLSISLQETPVSVDAIYNVSTAENLTTRYMSAVDELVLSNDELAGTLDGIECMLLQAKHDSNNGRVRRGWATYRRGISFAQLLGLHLCTARSEQSNENTLRKQSIWNALYLGDRYMSLMLGLPYGVSESHVNNAIGSNGSFAHETELQRAENDYLFRLAGVAGHIIDRNQTPSSNDTLTLTVKIEGEMTDLAASMPSSWWALEISQENIPAQLYGRILPQFWHHQTRTLLHLPFMLKAATDPRYGYNKIAALESARRMIGLYQMFRPAQGFGSLVCKIIDFQAFTAAMILVLNFLGMAQSGCASDLKDADDDRELVSSITSILQRASLKAGGGVATQAARALEMFGKAKDQGFLGGQGTSKVAIPYFGTVVFGPGKSFVNQSHPQKPDQLQQQPTPEEEPLATPNPDQESFGNDLASMPSDFNFNAFPLQQNQGPGVDSNAFANFNLDLDGDWSWFWNNTDFSYSEAQL